MSDRPQADSDRATHSVPSPREPFSISLALDEEPWPRRLHRVSWALVFVGAVARLVRYLLRFPLWGDECCVAANLLDRSYVELLAPLDFFQVCPAMFLWIELSIVKLCGFSEWSLRAFPCLCSIGGVFLFRHLAGRLLGGVPQVLAIGIFAVAYYPIRHGAEVKPYASDLATSLMMLAMAIEWWRLPTRSRWLWALAASMPLAIGLSFPAVFVAGGVSLALLGSVWRTRSAHMLVAYAAFNATLLASCLAWYVVSVRGQIAAAVEQRVMLEYWSSGFPPLADLGRLAIWLVATHSGQMFAYPVGGGHGGGALTFACSTTAAIVLFRRGRGTLVALCLAPLALNFVAASLRQYPYGASARVSLYLAPMICLLAGVGAASMMSVVRKERLRRLSVLATSLLLASLGTASIARDVLQPYKTAYDRACRNFARRFWVAQASDAELACAWTDLKRTELFPPLYHWRGLAQYLSNQRMYSPRHRDGAAGVQWDRVTTQRPLRCAVFDVPASHRNERALAAWLDEMAKRFVLVRREAHDFDRSQGDDSQGQVAVYEFVPRNDTRLVQPAN